MLLLLGFAFLAGLVTILAPCIWPILPIVLSSSVAGTGNRRPLGITLGIVASFAFFTLSISYLVKIFHLNPDSLRYAAIAIIGILGLTMAIPRLSTILETRISRLSSVFGSGKEGSGFFGGFLSGASLGLVWSPCAGPILAAIATLAATGAVTFAAVLVTLAYVTGIGIPLFAIAYGGRQFITRTRFLSRYTGRIQQAFGVVMLLGAVAILTNYDRVLETKLLDAFPVLSQTLNQFESNGEVTAQLQILKGQDPMKVVPTGRQSMLYLNTDSPAPDFAGVSHWLNTDAPLSVKGLRGKVVLVDFWTYTCINCIRTLPHVVSWYEKYKNEGFVVIGVHTPEFQFERDTKNVLDAIQRYKIGYPVAQDNDYKTWNSFNNQYWPAEYLIDARGNVRRTHFGEGEYHEMEMAIRELVRENGHATAGTMSELPDQTPTGVQSPETYLGAYRMEYSAGVGNTGTGERSFLLVQDLRPNSFSFGGNWDVRKEYAVAGMGASLNYRFLANKVFLVLRPGGSSRPGSVSVLLDGQPVGPEMAGADVTNGKVAVNSERLYNLVDSRGKKGEHVLLLKFDTPGIEAFAFTFG